MAVYFVAAETINMDGNLEKQSFATTELKGNPGTTEFMNCLTELIKLVTGWDSFVITALTPLPEEPKIYCVLRHDSVGGDIQDLFMNHVPMTLKEAKVFLGNMTPYDWCTYTIGVYDWA